MRGEWGTRLGDELPARRGTHSAHGETTQRRTPVWGLAKGAVRPGCHAWDAATLGIRAATMGVRSVAAGRPEQGEAAVPLSVSSSYAAVMGKQPELVVRSNRRVRGKRSASTRSAGEKPKGKELPGYRPGSSRPLLSVGLP